LATNLDHANRPCRKEGETQQHALAAGLDMSSADKVELMRQLH
jgi:hypothetical protein